MAEPAAAPGRPLRGPWRGPGRGPWWAWAVCSVLAGVAPLLWPGSFSLTVLSQIGIAVIACGAYQWLLGQAGLLSFGHAVYGGLGAFLAMHTLRQLDAGMLALPVSALPLVGGLAGAATAVVLGWLATRHSGSAFAMITLGLGELVWALALMLPELFGGEAGLAGNRVSGAPVAGISFGPAIEVYGLIAAYALACTAALQALVRTPAGRLLNAVRDNPERVAFLGVDPRGLRWWALVVSGFFSGVAGGLAALNFELVSVEALSGQRSAALLLFVVLGGSGHAAGPLIAALLMVLSQTLLSGLTPAWSLYLGLGFIVMVMLAPGGLASLPALAAAHFRGRRLRPLLPAGLALALVGGGLLAGVVLLVEMAYQHRLDSTLRPAWAQASQPFSPDDAGAWLGAVTGLALAAGLLAWRWRCWQRAWRAGLPQLAPYPADPAEPARGSRCAGAGDAVAVVEAMEVVDAVEAAAAQATTSAPATPATTVLELRDLHQHFGRTDVLRGVTLALRAGERVALIGPNGAGKTTLFNLVSGRQRPSRGSVWLNGRRIDGLAPQQIRRRGLSRSFQISSLFPRLSVFEHLRCALLADQGLQHCAWRPLGRLHALNHQADELLARLHLAHRRDAPAMTLSHAEQRALEIGVTIAGAAEVVLLDEPSAGMSHSETRRLIPLIRALTAGKTLLMVEHDMGVVFGLADRVAVLAQGELIAFDTPEAVRADARVRQAYLGDLGDLGDAGGPGAPTAAPGHHG